MNQNNNDAIIDLNHENNSKIIVNKKNNKKRVIIIIVCVCIFIYLLFNSSLLGYHSTDFKSDEQLEKYLVNYLNHKYDIDCHLKLESKELDKFCTFWLDTCWHYAKNNSIYNYRYTGIDENNNKFQIDYTNSYIGKGIHKSVINENYHIYDDVKKIKRMVNNHYNVSDVYFQLAPDDNYSNINDNEIVIRIYDEKNNTNILSNVNDDIISISKKFKIIYTTDYETYKTILVNNYDYLTESYSWKEPNIISENLKYNRINFNDNSSYKQALSLIELGNDNYTIVLMNWIDTKYYIYKKQNNE